MTEHERRMREALRLAEEAAAAGEIPVGCVIYRGDEKIGFGRNAREAKHSALSHAEIEAIQMACERVGDWRLSDCALYVTLEPCPMCAGAIMNARIPLIFYGAEEPQSGACGSVINLFEEDFGAKARIYGGLLREECGSVIRKFFTVHHSFRSTEE